MVTVRGRLRTAKLTSRSARKAYPQAKAKADSPRVSQTPAPNSFLSERPGRRQLSPPRASSSDCNTPKKRTAITRTIFRGVQSGPTLIDSMAAARKRAEHVQAQAHQRKNSVFLRRWYKAQRRTARKMVIRTWT